MKLPAVRLEESRSPYQVNVGGRVALKATSSDPIDRADQDLAEILARARFLHRDSNVARPSSANDSRTVTPFPRLGLNEDAGAGTEPASPIWSGRTRLSLIVGLPLALWAGIFALAHFVL